jgi:hypothetical protein
MRSLFRVTLAVAAVVVSTGCSGSSITPSAHTSSASFSAAFPGVLTWHNDAARTGQNSTRPRLLPRT